MQQTNQRRKLYVGIQSALKNQSYKFSSNYIRTTKYSAITFLPLSILFQFRRLANLYFLIIAILQSIPVLSPLNPITAILPLSFVIFLSVTRQGIQDYARYKSDKQNNSSKTLIYQNEQFVQRKWKNIKVGNIVKVNKDQIIPCDLVLIVSSSRQGQAYIQTSSLDGQKTLKHKTSLRQFQLLYNQLEQLVFKNFTATIQCSHPSQNLYQFQGYIKQADQKWVLNNRQLLYRGARFKNTDWAIGICVYSGQDTKIMKNSGNSRLKISKVQGQVNYFILGIMGLQVCCCLATSGYAFFQCKQNRFQWVQNGFDFSCTTLGAITFFSYFLLNNTMIPISLIVSLQIVKFVQGLLMQQDKQMYSSVRQKKLRCLTVSLNQQLGQIQYICTDKTGTLTANHMQFKYIMAGHRVYGYDEFEQDDKSELMIMETRQIRQSSKVFSQINKQLKNQILLPQPLILDDAKQGVQYLYQKDILHEMLLIMSCCHECVGQKDQVGNIQYQGPSPDEICLVSTANKMGYCFKNVQNGIINVNILGINNKIELLYLFQFTSTRKRMSIVIRQNGIIKVLCKGADSILQARLAQKQPFIYTIKSQINQYAKKGLRTLFFAQKIVPQARFQAAKSAILGSIGTAFQKKQLQNQVSYFQSQLVLVGATALQDKLQDMVPQTLRDFLKANIKVIMLTGDKLQTAESIARSCNLLPQKVVSFQYKGQRPNINQDQPFVFFVQGQNFLQFNQAKILLLKYLILRCKAGVFCRVSPKQKAQVVAMIKQCGQKVMAIGDGSNDVNMIMQADVGVGIYGQQGAGAVNNSNYAVGQFKILWKLLLYHGRLNYIRISDMILYFFYKNMVFTVPQTVFCFYCYGSGLSVFDNWAITLYNMIFTLLPVMIRAIFQVDVYIQHGEAIRTDIKTNPILYKYYPRLYYVGQMDLIFTTFRFLKWLLLGAIQGILCFIIIFYSLSGPNVTGSTLGYQTKFQFFSITLYTAIIFLVTLKLALNTQFWNWLIWFAYIVASIGTYLLFMFVSNIWTLSGIYQQTGSLITMPTFYLAVFYAILAMFTVDLLMFSNHNLKDSLVNYIKYSQDPNQSKIQKLDRRVDVMHKSREHSVLQSFKQYREPLLELEMAQPIITNDEQKKIQY